MSLNPTVRVNVDVANPGQFFTRCGLTELADRLCPGAEGQGVFCLGMTGSCQGAEDTDGLRF